jgi:hypothetical protein
MFSRFWTQLNIKRRAYLLHVYAAHVPWLTCIDTSPLQACCCLIFITSYPFLLSKKSAVLETMFAFLPPSSVKIRDEKITCGLRLSKTT